MSHVRLEELMPAVDLIKAAIAEDLGSLGDVTTLATIPESLKGRAIFVARTSGVLAGAWSIWLVAERVQPTLGQPLTQDSARLKVSFHKDDGDALNRGESIATIEGPMRSILAAERTALNFLQHLSGIATLTRKYVDAVVGTKAKILDTRKTLPGWRLLEKYAVRMGGGTNHRVGLYDGILIKDNHLAAVRKELGGTGNEIEVAIRRCREANPTLPIEIEVDSLEQLDRALVCRPDIVLLDNMNRDELRSAVARRDAIAPSVQLEASGGVNLDTVRGIAETGVDCISVGAITHSAPALDIALDYID